MVRKNERTKKQRKRRLIISHVDNEQRAKNNNVQLLRI